MDDLKDNFMIEAVELLDEAEEALLEIDNGADYSVNYNQLFRSFHSLKGASGMFGLDILQEHMHKLESLLDKVSEEECRGYIDYFLEGVDKARTYFETDKIEFTYISYNQEESEVKSAVKKIDAPDKSKIKNNLEKKKRDKDKQLVFVVEDEEIILEMVCEILEEAGYETRAFTDGKNVIDHIDDGEPDLIVSDINMPIVDGITMNEKLVELGFRIPIIYVSAFVTKDAVLTGLKNGASYFIEKPFDEKHLITLVGTILDGVKAKKIFIKSMDYILYQFSNHEELLRENGKTRELELMKDEIQKLLKAKNQLK